MGMLLRLNSTIFLSWPSQSNWRAKTWSHCSDLSSLFRTKSLSTTSVSETDFWRSLSSIWQGSKTKDPLLALTWREARSPKSFKDWETRRTEVASHPTYRKASSLALLEILYRRARYSKLMRKVLRLDSTERAWKSSFKVYRLPTSMPNQQWARRWSWLKRLTEWQLTNEEST